MPEHGPLNYEPSETVHDRFEKMLAVARNVIRIGVVIFGFGFIGSLIAFGALVQADRDSPIRTTAKRTIWVGIAVGSVNALIVTSLLLYGAMQINERVARTYCPHHLRSIGMAIQMYANDYGDVLPPSFQSVIATQDITTEVFICPGSADAAANLPVNTTAAQRAASVVEGTGTRSYFYRPPVGVAASQLTPRHVIAYEKPTNHNGDGGSILFGDWHVERVPKGQFEQIIAEVEAGQNPPPSVK